MNRNLLIIPAIVLTMGLTSCNKYSRSNVLKFVRENYKNEDPKTPSKHEIKWDFSKCVGDSAKAFAMVIILGFTEGRSYDLTGSYSYTTSEIEGTYILPLNEETFEMEYNEHNDCKFSINNKELTVKYDVGNSNKNEIIYNSDGYRRYEKTIIYIEDEKGRSVNGTTERIYSY